MRIKKNWLLASSYPRPNLAQFWSLKTDQSMFLNYLKLVDVPTVFFSRPDRPTITILEPWNPWIGIYKRHEVWRSTDFEAREFWKGRSGGMNDNLSTKHPWEETNVSAKKCLFHRLRPDLNTDGTHYRVFSHLYTKYVLKIQWRKEGHQTILAYFPFPNCGILVSTYLVCLRHQAEKTI